MIKSASVNGFRMEYSVFGQGSRPLVIIPGLSLKSVLLSAQSIAAAFADFEPDFTVYMFDVRQDLPDAYTIDMFADDTAAVIRSLGINRAAVYGASMGGMVAQALTVRHPDLVSRLEIASSRCRKTANTPDTIARWHELAAAKDLSRLVPDMLEHIYSPRTIRKYKDAMLLANAGITAEELRRCRILTDAIDRFDYDEELAKITCPVLITGSDGDLVFGPDSAPLLAEKTRGELFMYPAEFGHAVYDESPDFLPRLHRFLLGNE